MNLLLTVCVCVCVCVLMLVCTGHLIIDVFVIII